MSKLNNDWKKKLTTPFLDLEEECRKTDAELDNLDCLNSNQKSDSQQITKSC